MPFGALALGMGCEAEAPSGTSAETNQVAAPPGADSVRANAAASHTAEHTASALAGPNSAANAPSAPMPAGTTTPTSDCPEDMVLVEGAFCPELEQRCLVHTKEWDEAQKRRARQKADGGDPGKNHVSERCLKFEPSKCLSASRQQLRFCMDRYEWPNRVGEKPAFMITWTEAVKACAGVGKRLCSADEFTFACEGEQLLPYSYGLERDDKKCNIDKPYVQPRFKLLPYELCLKSPKCKAHMEELDQRNAIGQNSQCTSPFGAFDINGNVNEWVERPGEKQPWRSGLKGGWWGPSRSRCRPMVTAHDENYVGYEVGFRCCAAAR